MTPKNEDDIELFDFEPFDDTIIILELLAIKSKNTNLIVPITD